MTHYQRYAAFRDTVLKDDVLKDKKVAAYAIVVIDEQGEVYAGSSNTKQCLPELQKLIDYYQPPKPAKKTR